MIRAKCKERQKPGKGVSVSFRVPTALSYGKSLLVQLQKNVYTYTR